MRGVTVLYPHQVPAVEKLLPTRVGGLFMEMGTGKTRVAIELVLRRRARIRRCVWFCPVSLKETILAEIEKHVWPAEVYKFDGATRVRTLPAVFWYIVGIESMSSSDRVVLAANALIDEETFVVLDESSYIKGHDARRTRRITMLSARAGYRLALTGTPLSQGVVDLYAQMRFLSPEILGYKSFYSFARNHLEYSEKYPGMIVRAHNTGWLAAKIAPYVYQVTKEEAGLELPAKLFDRRYVRLTEEQQAWYERAKQEILLSVPDWELDSYVIFRLFGALQQIASGFWNRVEQKTGERQLVQMRDGRLPMLMAVARGLPDEKVVVWCKFHYSVRRIVRALCRQYGEEAVTQFHGGLGEDERNGEIARFRGPARFLVATMASGGHGLTLTEAAYAVFYENEFKYANRIQAEDRLHRLGQKRRPMYIDIVSNAGIDRRIQEALAAKANVVERFRLEVERVKDDRERVFELAKTV